MNKESREAVRRAIKVADAYQEAAEAQIATYREQIALMRSYLDGERKNPFDPAELQKEIDRHHVHIDELRTQIAQRRESIETLRAQLEKAEELNQPPQEIVINLRPKGVLKPTSGV